MRAILFPFFAFLALPQAVLAQELPPTSLPANITSIAGLYDLVCGAVNWVFAFVMVAAVFAILAAGLRFMTAAGSEEGVAAARRYLAYAIVGVLVAVLARSLVLTGGDFLGANISSAVSCF